MAARVGAYLITSVLALAGCASNPARFDARVEAFNAVPERLLAATGNNPYAPAFTAALRTAFNDELAPYIEPNHLARMTPQQLLDVLGAAFTVTFYTSDPTSADIVECIAGEMERRDQGSDLVSQKLQQALVLTRQWGRAAEIQTQYPDRRLEEIPPAESVVASTEPVVSYWTVSAAPSMLARQAFAFSAGAQIVVVSSPLCHFSQNATAAIEFDPALRRMFRDHSVWIRPVDPTLDWDTHVHWNRDHADFPIHLAHAHAEWPEIDYWGTPTFYFFMNGKLVESVSGWPAEGNKASVLAAAAKVGLYP